MSQENKQYGSTGFSIDAAQAEATSVDAGRFRVDAGGKPTLVGGKCGHCGCQSWGLRKMCPRCWADDKLAEVALPDVGELYSMVTVHRGQAGFRAPYTVGLVDLPGNVRVFGRIHWPEGSRWHPGAPMQLVAERIEFDDKPPIWMPAFRPKGEGSHA